MMFSRTLKTTVVIVLVAASIDFQTVASDNDELLSQIIERQEENYLRIERLESRINHLANNVERFGKLNDNCRCVGHLNDQKTYRARRELPYGPTLGDGVPSALPSKRRSIERRSTDASTSTVADRQASFLRGEPGRNGLDGVPGLDGAPGLDGVPGTDGRNGRDGVNGRDGKDGKDGTPGERGPIGPPGLIGPPGEAGKRGKLGAPGKTGAPGLPGVCAYTAKYDCTHQVSATNGSTNSVSHNSTSATLLIAPTMIGQARGDAMGGLDERQVTVNEGDNIQLSCEAFGLPKPDYIWRRSTTNNKSTILIDVATDLQVTSYSGSQLPLFSVDRLQSGTYECLASNGVPPAAIKRINLDVHYASTVRLYPSPSVYQVKLGSSLSVECLVDANPSPFTYWMFGSELIMSIAPPSTQLSAQAQDEGELSAMAPTYRWKKYTITESTGQLTTGAYYTIVTLSVANIGPGDLGLYKCVSKNLVGQTVGYVWLESHDDGPGLSSTPPLSSGPGDRKFRETILERGTDHERLDHILGWPSYLIERDADASYSTYGNEHRRRIITSAKKSLAGLNDSISKILLESLIQNLNESKPIIRLRGESDDKGSSRTKMISDKAESALNAAINLTKEHNNDNQIEQAVDLTDKIHEDRTTPMADDIELCRIESDLVKAPEMSNSAAQRLSVQLLDQVGKPVYVGSISDGSLNWWSMDSKLTTEINDNMFNSRIFATFDNKLDALFEYKSLTDLLKDHQSSATNMTSTPTPRVQYSLQHSLCGNSHLIHGSKFIHVTLSGQSHSPKSFQDLMIVMFDLKSGENSYLRFDNKILRNIESQPFELGPEYKLNRIELASDENGIWVILPTIESIPEGLQDPLPDRGSSDPHTPGRATGGQVVRRLHVFKIYAADEFNEFETKQRVQINYHVSMKLDWRMIGQLFVIDGVLYGIKDRNLYSSKLQFAYDLYKCKLLSTEYLNESHRTFTNHFGNTQMIKYNPNEPKRLYTIDNGNLLWCPVKLIKVNPNEIWQPQYR